MISYQGMARDVYYIHVFLLLLNEDVFEALLRRWQQREIWSQLFQLLLLEERHLIAMPKTMGEQPHHCDSNQWFQNVEVLHWMNVKRSSCLVRKSKVIFWKQLLLALSHFHIAYKFNMNVSEKINGQLKYFENRYYYMVHYQKIILTWENLMTRNL